MFIQRRNRRPLAIAASIIALVATGGIAAAMPGANASTVSNVDAQGRPGHVGVFQTDAAGRVTTLGVASSYGNLNRDAAHQSPVVAIMPTSTGNGYWLVEKDGHVTSYGDAKFLGSPISSTDRSPVVAASSAATGYRIVLADGSVWDYGVKTELGDAANTMNPQAIVNTPSGNGYWLVGSTGWIIAKGDAKDLGKAALIDGTPNSSPVAAVATTDGTGLFVVNSIGHVGVLGSAKNYGQGVPPGHTIIGIRRSDTNKGYTLIASDGWSFKYGDASSLGNGGGPVDTTKPTTTTTTPSSSGYDAGWKLTHEDDFNSSLNKNLWSVYSAKGGSGGVYSAYDTTVSNGDLNLIAHDGMTAGVSMGTGTTYGKYEIRARMDAGQGYGPAILLWSDNNKPSWPFGGEYDIAEMPSASRAQVNTTIHYSNYAGSSKNIQIQQRTAIDGTQWHTYALDWEPTYIETYIDGRLVQDVTTAAAIQHHSMHLGMEVDEGTVHYMGLPTSATPAQVGLHVDWVKQYAAN